MRNSLVYVWTIQKVCSQECIVIERGEPHGDLVNGVERRKYERLF